MCVKVAEIKWNGGSQTFCHLFGGGRLGEGEKGRKKYLVRLGGGGAGGEFLLTQMKMPPFPLHPQPPPDIK